MMRLPAGFFTCLTALATVAAGFALDVNAARAEGLVPGTGRKVSQVGDDFEDPDWKYHHNGYKSSEEQDGQHRLPSGRAANGRLVESMLRGHPDVIRRVPTPEGGIEGSHGALLLRSKLSGVPGRISHTMQQDDLLVNVEGPLKGYVPIRWSPNFVVRVYLPPFEKWENRTGISFGIRAGLQGSKYSTNRNSGLFGSFTSGGVERDTYWPGFFIFFNSSTDRNVKEDSAHLLLRAGPTGHDFRGPDIEQLGWWTFGISITPDGKVHYYAHPGVADLTQEDHIASQYPYGFRAERFETFFFNVANHEDGRNWTTPWIIDDPTLYIITNENRTVRRGGNTRTRRRGR